jgi:hypothetical protein
MTNRLGIELTSYRVTLRLSITAAIVCLLLAAALIETAGWLYRLADRAEARAVIAADDDTVICYGGCSSTDTHLLADIVATTDAELLASVKRRWAILARRACARSSAARPVVRPSSRGAHTLAGTCLLFAGFPAAVDSR